MTVGDEPRIVLGLFSGCAREGTHEVVLAPKERELLLRVAATEAGFTVGELDVKPVALRVLVRRVRRRFAAPVLESAGSGRYRLAQGVTIDLLELRRHALAVVRDDASRGAFASQVQHALEELRANPLRQSPWFAPISRRLNRAAHEFLTEALGSTALAKLF